VPLPALPLLVVWSASASHANPITPQPEPSASVALLRRLLLFRLRRPRGSPLRRRSGALLFVPLIELLLLLLLLLRAALLYRRSGPDQGMRLLRSRPHFLLLRWPEISVRRLRIAILLRLSIPILRLLHISVLGRRSSLLFVRPRLRLRHLSDLTIAAVGLCERPEAVLRRLRSIALIHLRGLRGAHWTNQCLLVQMSAGLRLPLLDGVRKWWRRPDGHHRTADDRCRRPH